MPYIEGVDILEMSIDKDIDHPEKMSTIRVPGIQKCKRVENEDAWNCILELVNDGCELEICNKECTIPYPYKVILNPNRAFLIVYRNCKPNIRTLMSNIDRLLNDPLLEEGLRVSMRKAKDELIEIERVFQNGK